MIPSHNWDSYKNTTKNLNLSHFSFYFCFLLLKSAPHDVPIKNISLYFSQHTVLCSAVHVTNKRLNPATQDIKSVSTTRCCVWVNMEIFYRSTPVLCCSLLAELETEVQLKLNNQLLKYFICTSEVQSVFKFIMQCWFTCFSPYGNKHLFMPKHHKNK